MTPQLYKNKEKEMAPVEKNQLECGSVEETRNIKKEYKEHNQGHAARSFSTEPSAHMKYLLLSSLTNF